MMDLKGSTRTVDFARLYARKGYWCVPLWHSAPDGCGCGNPVCDEPGAHPIGTVVADATENEDELLALFARYPTPNVGVVTGSPSGVVAVSVDTNVIGGNDSWQRLTFEYGLPLDTPAIVGSHLWSAIYRLPSGFPALPQQLVHDDLPGVRLSGEGAFVVAPPSVDPFTDAPCRWSRTGEPAIIEAAVLDLFLEPVRHLTSVPIPRTPFSLEDSQTYLKGFYQHLRAVGFPAPEASEMTSRKSLSLASPPTQPEIGTMLAEVDKAAQKEANHEISLD